MFNTQEIKRNTKIVLTKKKKKKEKKKLLVAVFKSTHPDPLTSSPRDSGQDWDEGVDVFCHK